MTDDSKEIVRKKENQEQIISQYAAEIDQINSTLGVKNVDLYTNNVLAKNPYSGGGVLRLLNDQHMPPVSFFTCIWNMCVYFIKSFAFIFLWACKKLLFNLIKSNKVKEEGLHIVDIFILSQNVSNSEKFHDRYLSGLVEVLSKNGINYAYLPCFYKDGYSPYNWYKLYKTLKKSEHDFVTEFDLLHWSDLLKMTVFVFRYPVALIKLINRYSVDNSIKAALSYSLKLSLKDYTLTAFVRYLVGVNLAKKYTSFKLLSYCEFQVIDKTLFKGIRDTSKGVKIYAYQQFIKYPIFMNLYISELETNDTLPDRIIVTGDHYIPATTRYDYMSLSIRNRKVFEIESEISSSEILVLLPYFEKEAESILKLINSSCVADEKLLIKPHPTLNIEAYKNIIQDHWSIVGGDMYDFFNNTKIVITSSSGASIEAISVGISVIVVDSEGQLPIDPMIDLGRGIIWDKVENDLCSIYKQISGQRTKNIGQIKTLSDKYKQLFFSRPTDDKVLSSFDYMGVNNE